MPPVSEVSQEVVPLQQLQEVARATTATAGRDRGCDTVMVPALLNLSVSASMGLFHSSSFLVTTATPRGCHK